MTKERFLEICQQENFPRAEEAWDNRPPWVDTSEDDPVIAVIRAVVVVTSTKQFQTTIDKACDKIIAHAKANLN